MYHCPSCDYMKNCICATCLLVHEGKILMLHHNKLNKWMPPGGHVESFETPIDGLHREVIEETGYCIEIIDTYKTSAKDQYMHYAGVADEMIRPMTILLEYVKYKTENHNHFDLIYLAKVDDSKERVAAESSDNMKWFDKEKLNELDTFENVKILAQRALEAYSKYK